MNGKTAQEIADEILMQSPSVFPQQEKTPEQIADEIFPPPEPTENILDKIKNLAKQLKPDIMATALTHPEVQRGMAAAKEKPELVQPVLAKMPEEFAQKEVLPQITQKEEPPKIGLKDAAKSIPQLGRSVLGTAEGAVDFFTNLVGFVPSTIAGLGATAFGGFEKGEEVQAKVGEFIDKLYTPQTLEGAQAAELFSYPFQLLEAGIEKGATTMAPDEPETQRMLKQAAGAVFLATILRGGHGDAGKYLRSKAKEAVQKPFEVKLVKGLALKLPQLPEAIRNLWRKIPDETVIDKPAMEAGVKWIKEVSEKPVKPKVEKPAMEIAEEILPTEALPKIETAPGTEMTIDVTPKPGGGQTITIKSPERPVEPRTPVEPTPIAPEGLTLANSVSDYKKMFVDGYERQPQSKKKDAIRYLWRETEYRS